MIDVTKLDQVYPIVLCGLCLVETKIRQQEREVVKILTSIQCTRQLDQYKILHTLPQCKKSSASFLFRFFPGSFAPEKNLKNDTEYFSDSVSFVVERITYHAPNTHILASLY